MPAIKTALGAPAPIPAPARYGLASVAETCAFLRVSRQYIWLQTRAGRIQPVKLGRSVRYRWADLERIATHGLPAAPEKGGAQ